MAVAASALLAACGGGLGGGGGGGEPAAVSIQSTALPPAAIGVPYQTSLDAAGGAAPYTWAIGPGPNLPPGLTMSDDGVLSGTPAQTGSWSFSLVVTDSSDPAQTDTATCALTVAEFGVSLSLLHWGDAWTGESYPVSAVGGTTFTLVQNQTGATLSGADPEAGTATYVAGPTPGTDRVRGTSASGAVAEATVVVRANPVAAMTGRFSTTDVWHVRFSGKKDGSHPYASDFDWALATIGMRAASSTGSVGTTADEVASAYVRREVLSQLSRFYLNAADGSATPDGLEVSFPFQAPLPPHFCPADGRVARGAANQFNVMSVIAGGDSGVIGTAYLDDDGNPNQENDTTTSSAGDLGVFVDEIAPIFNGAYSNDLLPSAPVSDADVPALKALLYGLPEPAGSRYDELRRVGTGFARTVAAVAAHEIGHSLSLSHTSPSRPGSIMNASAMISPSATYAFTDDDVDTLRSALPGLGRGGSPQRVDAAHVVGPEEGEEDALPVCSSCRCSHR